jgi:hypothetical protein
MLKAFFVPLRAILLILGVTFWAPYSAIAQVPEGWTQAEGPSGTTYTYKSAAAIIMIGLIPLEKLQNPGGAISATDKPGGCVGISNANFETVLGGRARRIQSRSPSLSCAIFLAPFGDKGLMAIAMEQANAHANAAAIALTLLEKWLGPVRPSTSISALRPPAHSPSSARPIGGLARASDPVGLVGMWRSDWVENEYQGITGLTLVAKDNTLIFTAGGYFFDGVPDGVTLDDSGAQEIMRRDPQNAGRYTVSGGMISLTYANAKHETVEAKRTGASWDLVFRDRQMQPKMTFMAGGYLSGTYSTQRISQAGSSFVVGEDDYSFAPDGRFAKGGQVSLSSAALSSTAGRTVRTGRYFIKASALTLLYDDGTREIYSMFQESAGKEIWLDDQMYRPASSE